MWKPLKQHPIEAYELSSQDHDWLPRYFIHHTSCGTVQLQELQRQLLELQATPTANKQYKCNSNLVFKNLNQTALETVDGNSVGNIIIS